MAHSCQRNANFFVYLEQKKWEKNSINFVLENKKERKKWFYGGYFIFEIDKKEASNYNIDRIYFQYNVECTFRIRYICLRQTHKIHANIANCAQCIPNNTRICCEIFYWNKFSNVKQIKSQVFSIAFYLNWKSNRTFESGWIQGDFGVTFSSGHCFFNCLFSHVFLNCSLY